jgi:glycosyltransferase involved in cell wall biosynthesis
VKKLAIITTHPIQYYAPVFKLLHQRNNISIKVFYTWGEASSNKHDPGFGKNISWDIPLLDGYPYVFLKNSSKGPGSHHFTGISNPGIKHEIKMYNPDAILVYGWAFQSHLSIMRHYCGKIPIWFRGDSTLEDSSSGLRKFFRYLFLRWVYSFVDHTFFVGAANKRYYEKFGLSKEQLHFAPHAIDNKRFQIDRNDEAQELRARFNIDPHDILILFAGKLEPKKDPELLLKAFSQLNKPHVHLLIVGEGVLKERLLEARDNIPNKHHLHFLDFQNQQQMPVIYQACDLFCLPSKGPGETWGLAVNEAMACGKAILVSDRVGCAEDLINEGHNGAVFRHGSGPHLLEKLSILVKDLKELNKMGENSLSMIKEWTIEKQALIIEDCINSDAK